MAWNIFEDRPLAGKIALIGLIVVGLMIPLSMLRGLIAERSQMRTQAVATVAKGWGGPLSAGGPIIRVPFDVERKSRTGEISIESHQLYILADDLKAQATLEHAATRRVGIYGVPVYLVHIDVNAGFRMSEVLAAAETGPYVNMTLHWKEARIRLPLSDVRSVREIGSASVGQHPLTFGPALANGIPGVEAKIDLSEFLQQESLPFSAQLILAGSESLNFLPTAAKSTLELQSNWPDPQFQGAFLPSQYHVDSHGFQAQWQVLALNRAFAQSWVDAQVDTAKLASAGYGVGLFQSVDVYQRSERAVKYALVFIALTFLSFLAWEALAQMTVHPVQYGLVGLALEYLLFAPHRPCRAPALLVELLAGSGCAGRTPRLLHLRGSQQRPVGGDGRPDHEFGLCIALPAGSVGKLLAVDRRDCFVRIIGRSDDRNTQATVGTPRSGSHVVWHIKSLSVGKIFKHGDHAPAHWLVRKRTHSAGQILHHMGSLAGRRGHDGDRRVSDDKLQKEFRPSIHACFSRPLRHVGTGDSLEQVAAAKRHIAEHGNAAIDCQRQDLLLDFTIIDRIIIRR